jgi:nitronate monooxygenase
VLQGVEAGGHVRGTTPLLELLDSCSLDVPVVAAGGITTGAARVAALAGGADAVRVGTRFVATPESAAHPAYVDALVAGTDTALTTAFDRGWPDAPHRVLASALEGLGATTGGDVQPPTRGETGDVAARALYAGVGVADVRDAPPAAVVLDRLLAEARGAGWRG